MEQTIPYEIELDEFTSDILHAMDDPNEYINSLLDDTASHEKHVKELEKKEQSLEQKLSEIRKEREWFESLIENNKRRETIDKI